MNKRENLKSFSKEYVDEFYEYLSSIKNNLRHTNSEYAKLYKQIYEILDNNLNLQKIIEEEELENGLSTVDCISLSKLILLYYKIKDIEDEELFFAGSMNAYYYFRDMRIIE